MKMALKDGQILIREADNVQFTIIKSWGKMELMKMILQMLGMGCLIVVALIVLIFLIACLVAVVKSLNEKK